MNFISRVGHIRAETLRNKFKKMLKIFVQLNVKTWLYLKRILKNLENIQNLKLNKQLKKLKKKMR